MRVFAFCLTFANAFLPEGMADFPNNPDVAINFMKTIVIPMAKAEFDSLDHEQMHREMEADNLDMRFVDRAFDFCVGEDRKDISFDEDKECSQRIVAMIKNEVPDMIPTETFANQPEDEELRTMLYKLFDVDKDGKFSRQESKNVLYCYMRIIWSKIIGMYGIPADAIAQLSTLSTVIPEAMNTDEARVYFQEHQRLYQKFQQHFNQERLTNLFQEVEPTSRGITKLSINLMDEFSEFAEAVYIGSDYDGR
ncbi:Oidioi.mRNA.OKI2018_I69.chr2.g6205.t1.cds [Oikopleura dioica]|uniref:Oidioi.mRNA.OKI2018_I69.chr2.g6205.t1.cds n=1 Tax=Oikopleura dioica TaxID=34765 RepID=A0ABN7T9D8_OIKDI|nr:Oidioi.mRNA.OKI2018_I69.chr2.g6205.t1.cds [Oikopleura dioica]